MFVKNCFAIFQASPVCSWSEVSVPAWRVVSVSAWVEVSVSAWRAVCILPKLSVLHIRSLRERAGTAAAREPLHFLLNFSNPSAVLFTKIPKSHPGFILTKFQSRPAGFF
ncbi:hypothetical protein [Methanimicrococcus hongohii]|uniref:hypothetical protein n=1 Tax=Methanimicrococcus hongohii TaxID=3028295 RepID=UPI00292CB47D|nr:hypothetical protein [Methanimicrococcus sp. Hf6]